MNNTGYKFKPRGCTAGWRTIGNEPVLGGSLGTCFDVYVIKENALCTRSYDWSY